VSATKHQNKCTTSETTAFETACGDNSTQATCTTWLEANTEGSDGGGGTACGNCIFNPDNNGAAWVDPNGAWGPNYAACIQLTDTSKGPACAAALENIDGCEGLECDDCADSTTYQTCATTVDGTICSSYLSPAQTACSTDFADGGAADTCQPGGGTKANPDWTYIIDLICGK
jgi:hypothetical protein